MDNENLLLTDDDRRTALHLRLVEHLEAKLQRYRIKNDGKLSFDDTNRLRGRIAEIQLLLAALMKV